MDESDAAAEHARQEFIVLCAQWLLLKLGGQISFNIDELQRLSAEYAGTRMAYSRETGDVTLTLRTREAENERTISHPAPPSQAHTP